MQKKLFNIKATKPRRYEINADFYSNLILKKLRGIKDNKAVKEPKILKIKHLI